MTDVSRISVGMTRSRSIYGAIKGFEMPCALRELVRAIYVEAPDKSSKRKQKIHIEYDLVGFIPVDKLIKTEQA